MAFNVTNTFNGQTTLVASDLDQNFTDIESLLNGNLTTANISASSGITNSQLSTSGFEFVLSCRIDGTATANEGLNNTTGGFFVVGAIPYDTTGGAAAYTIEGIEHMLYVGTGVPSTALVVDLKYGNHTDTFSNIQTGISTGTANGQTRETGFTSSVSASATRPNFFILDVTTQGVGFNDGDSWCISIKLTRTNGLRG